MTAEFAGIEWRLDELSERLARLRPVRDRTRIDSDEAPYLRDIAERNLEVSAQCCIDISHRTISIECAQKPIDYYDAILRMGELGVLQADFARRLAPVAGFRNVLVQEHVAVDWDEVYDALHRLEDFERFAGSVRRWMANRASSSEDPDR